ncbi:hypothetical protein K1719_035192 [Acacia pycnantha]|nr:hypothetical protein K1719_035192 [Acacia pycnantha]
MKKLCNMAKMLLFLITTLSFLFLSVEGFEDPWKTIHQEANKSSSWYSNNMNYMEDLMMKSSLSVGDADDLVGVSLANMKMEGSVGLGAVLNANEAAVAACTPEERYSGCLSHPLPPTTNKEPCTDPYKRSC